jgi:hypothetical protein
MVKITPPRHKLVTNAKLGKLGSQKKRQSVPERKPYRYPDGKIIVVNRVEQTVRCYENSVLFHHCECVLGRYGHETPLGCYKVTDKIPDHESHEFRGSLMHWSVFFIRERGIALHQYHGDTSLVGWFALRRTQALAGSAGCVRLKEADAKKIYEWAVKYTTSVWVVDMTPTHGTCGSP